MTTVELIAAVRAAMEIAAYVSSEEKRNEWEKRFEKIHNDFESLRSLLCEILDEVRGDVSWAAEAAKSNPAMRRRPPVAGLLALVLGSSLVAAGCFGVHGARFVAIEETEELHPGYAVMWPTDASQSAEDYHTVQVDGRMVTTVPRVEGQ